jgi:hypothetical protein
VLAWLQRFPLEIVREDARLMLVKAWVLSLCEYLQLGPITQYVTTLQHPNGGPPANVQQHQPDHGLAHHSGA